MTELTLQLDSNALNSFKDLMRHYGLDTKAEVVTKGLSLLKIAAYVDSTDGELIVRRGSHETKIIVR